MNTLRALPSEPDLRALYRRVGEHALAHEVDGVLEAYAAALWPRSGVEVQLELVPRRGDGLDASWSSTGTGVTAPEAGLWVDRGLAGARRRHRRELTPADALAVDLLVRRTGGVDEDCPVTIENGGRAATLSIGRASVALASQAVPLDTGRFHAYRLVVAGEDAWLFVDGLLALRAPTAAATAGARLSLGPATSTGASDQETHWAWLRVASANGADAARALWPDPRLDEVHRREGERLFAEGRPLDGLAALRAGLALAPGDAGIAAALDAALATAAALPAIPLSELEAIAAALPRRENDAWRTTLASRRANVVMSARGLGVKFPTGPSSLRELVGSLFGERRLTRDSDFWAVRDVSLDVERGDIVGVIGRNGSGKSTLLRAMVPMLELDTGAVRVSGQPILLATGMGFREELTGRDNVFLGGVFLGLTRREIAERFDSIVDFAELRDHIDRPFGHYSDGMRARLIFAVATTISPDILLLDELLGAGDVSFHEKAAARMKELMARARSILVVTHDLQFVRRHCTRALYLAGGRVRYHGDPGRAVDLFLSEAGVSQP